MSDDTLGSGSAEASGGKPRWAHKAMLAAVCALIIAGYGWSAMSGVWESWGSHASESYYNLLVQGFRAGQLNLKREAPSGLAQLSDPYDPTANSEYRLTGDHPLQDLSYYKGKLYLYFGVTPALILFWPYAVLTGNYLLHKDVVVIFCAMGFLAGVGLLYALWRRYFATVSFGAVVAGTVALGLAAYTPVILPCSDVYEVAIGAGYALTMMSLAAVWRALNDPARRGWWLAAASLAYGLALGARPSLLFGAVILLVPVMQAWRERGRLGMTLLAAVGPVVLIGLGLMLYNLLRFDNPLEFGQRYELTSYGEDRQQHFSLNYLWFNFRVFFLAPAHWCGWFPFVQNIAVPPLPKGYVEVDRAFGVLSNTPVVWLALAAPLVWRGRSLEARMVLRWFVLAVTLLFGTSALMIGLHNSGCVRYEWEFVQPLMLLAVMGIWGLERALAGQLVWRRIIRWVWGLLLAFSVMFNLLESLDRQAETHNLLGNILSNRGHVAEALEHFQKAVALEPESSYFRTGLAITYYKMGGVDKAIDESQKALEIDPDNAEAQYGLGCSLLQIGRAEEAFTHFQKSLTIEPDLASSHDSVQVNTLAWSLATNPEASKRNGALAVKLAEGACQRVHYRETIIVGTLAAAYAEAGRFEEAIATAQKACALASEQGNSELLLESQKLLVLFRAHQPYHHGTANKNQTRP
jgi:tetratricopeptide (TPR) repeat protein